MNLLLALCMMLSTTALAAEWRLLDVDQASVSFMKFKANRDPQIYSEEHFRHRVQFDLGLQFLKYGFWKNNIHLETNRSQVKTAGWEYDMGVHLGPYIDVFHHHHSRHVLDSDNDIPGKFPVEDSYGVRFNFIGGK